ncbi:unnamed protein product [Closterium sp. Naga37s-1]|nr:unnamed protein product [Closterium sp. Naga37s-1]
MPIASHAHRITCSVATPIAHAPFLNPAPFARFTSSFLSNLANFPRRHQGVDVLPQAKPRFLALPLHPRLQARQAHH